MKWPLEVIQEACLAKELPTITVLVVSDGDGRPSTGCVAPEERGFRTTLEAVKANE
jgi:hypothetical protein